MPSASDVAKHKAFINSIVNSPAITYPNPVDNTARGPVGQSANFGWTPPPTDYDPSLFSRVMDVVSRPLYAVQNTAKDALEALTPGSKTSFNPFESIGAGLMGVDKTTGSDVIGQLGKSRGVDVPDWFKTWGGLASDIVVDPLNLIPGKALAAPLNAAGRVLKGTKKFEEAVDAGKTGMTEFTASEMKNRGTPVTVPTRPLEEKTAAASDIAADVNAGRQDAVNTKVAGDTVADPASALPDLADLATPSPANVGAKTKPITLKNFDPATLDFVKRTFVDNYKNGCFDTAEEAARAAAEAASKNSKDAANIYRTAFLDHPELGHAIKKEIADSQSVVTPKVADAVVPEAVNITPAGQVPIPKPSQARQSNAYEQARLTQELTNRATKSVLDDPAMAGSKFDQTSPRIYDNVLNDLKVSKEQAIQAGDYPVVKLGNNEYNLHIADVMDSLGTEHGVPLHLSKFEKIPTSSMLHGAAQAIEGKIGGLTGDDLIKSVADRIVAANKTKTPTSATKAERAAKTLIAHTDDLEQKLVENEARLGKRDLVQGEALGTSTANQVKAAVTDPLAPTAKVIDSVADVGGKIIRDGNAAGVSAGGQARAAAKAKDSLSDTLVPTDVEAAKTSKATAKESAKGTDEAKQKIADRQAKQMAADEAAMLADTDTKYVTLDDVVANTLDQGLRRGYHSVMGAMVNGHRMGGLDALIRDGMAFSEKSKQIYGKDLMRYKKQYDQADTLGAYTQLTTSPELGFRALQEEGRTGDSTRQLKPLLDHMLDVNNPDGAANALTRNGHSIVTANATLKEHGLNFQFPTKIPGNDNPTLADVFHTIFQHPQKDVIDFLSKMHSAVMDMEARRAFGVDIARRFGKKAVDGKMPEGYAGIVKGDYEKAPLSHFIPDGVGFDRVTREHLRRVNNMLVEARSYKRGDKGLYAMLASNVLNPYLRLWKPTATLIRPGHQIRNMIGDLSNSFLAGMSNPKHLKYAAQALKAGGQFRGDVKGLEKLLAEKGGEDLTKPMYSVKLKGGDVPLTPAQLYRESTRGGTLVGYKSSEDLLSAESKLERGQTGLDKAADWLADTKLYRGAGVVSENIADFNKLAHMSHKLNDPKFTSQFETLQDAIHEANKEVLRYHTDPAGLTPWESRNLRPIIPFYTWMRQAVPTILKTAATKPDRAMVIPKAYYAAAQQMGLDPKSLSDPTSNGGDLPSFLREGLSGNISLGDNQFTYNLGTPMETLADIFNDKDSTNLPRNIGTYLSGSLNPLLTIPTEAITRQDTATGNYVSDLSENLDQGLPFLNQLSSISGYSASGTIGNVFQGGNTPVLDPQRALAKGEKDAFWNRTLFNTLLGLGVQDTNRSSYQKLVAKENRT